MTLRIDLDFPGGKKVDAKLHGFCVATDQALEDGGEGSAPCPFDYFFVSLATCSGITAYAYCKKYGIDTQGLEVWMEADNPENENRYDRVTFHVKLPENFPEEHRDKIQQRINGCVVKKHILTPPCFELMTH
jgi:ribosomal protein S12 methylthiotransferase accessory factor